MTEGDARQRLAVAAAESAVDGAEAEVRLPASAWYVLGASGAGEVVVLGRGGRLPAHRLAVLLGRIREGGAVEQIADDTIYATRPTEDAEGGEEKAEDEPPYCGHEGNAEYGGGGGDPGVEPDRDGGGDEHPGDKQGGEHPGDREGDDGVTPESSGGCDQETGQETDQETDNETQMD